MHRPLAQIKVYLPHMIRHNFSFKEAFVFGWNKTKQHYWFCALTFILVTLIINSVGHVPILRTTVSLMAGLSIVSLSLLIARDQHFSFESLFTPLLSPMRVLKFFVLSAIYLIPVLLTVILLYYVPAKLVGLVVVIPCVYIMVRFKFFPYVVIENEGADLQSLIKMSYKLTRGHFWVVLGFLLLVLLLNILGALVFIVGLVVTVRVSIFATAHVYNKLKEHSI